MSPADTSMRGKVCLITGATSGIGLVTARELARRDAHVVIVGRDPARCDAALVHIRREATSDQVEALRADLSSQQQVRRLAQEFLDRHDRLDVLINNAGGIWFARQLTVDGLEMTFAVNHLAYFLLTHLLLDRLKASAPSRIINVASAAHRGAVLSFDDLMGEKNYTGWRAYRRSKLANLLFTYELARRLEGTGVTANAVHPGWVATRFGGTGWKGQLLQVVARVGAISPEKGARTVIYLATSPDVAQMSGRYFVKERVVNASVASLDTGAARRLWQVSLELTGLTPTGAAPHQV